MRLNKHSHSMKLYNMKPSSSISTLLPFTTVSMTYHNYVSVLSVRYLCNATNEYFSKVYLLSIW